MADEMAPVMENDTEEYVSETVIRIYEVGYHIVPTVKEEDLDKVVASIRSVVEKAGGSFIAEGAPAMTKLAYDITAREGDKNVVYDRGYFGWLKFETTVETAKQIEENLKRDPQILRSMLFRTVSEETRAKMKAPVIREVKRTDTIKAAPRREEVAAGPVSEEDLEKALQDITAE
jgi:ribosomal protein S6